MPQMGVSVSEGTVTKWLKAEGEPIARDEALLEISTDKVDTEVPSPGEGVAREDHGPGGRDRRGRRRARRDRAGRVGAGRRRRERRREPRLPSPRPRPRPMRPRPRRPRPPSPRAPTPAPAQPPTPADARRRPLPAPTTAARFVSPVVARIAAEHGVDVGQVQGTGNGGRVTKKDILAFVESGAPLRLLRGPLLQRPRAPAGSARPSRPRRAPAPAAGSGSSGRRRRRHAARSRARPRERARRRRDARAADRDAPGDRRAHAPLARHLRARDERDRGRHVEGGRDPRQAEEGVRGGLRRQPDLPRLHRPRDGRDAARVPLDQRRDPRRQDRDAQLRQPRLRGRARGRQGADRPGRQELRGAEPARPRALGRRDRADAPATRS